MGLEILDIADPRWNRLAQRFQVDIFYDPCYCRFIASGTSHRPVMFYYQDNIGEVIDVTLEKDIASLPFFVDVAERFSTSPVDLASPEYNSPVVLAEPAARMPILQRYRQAIDAYCMERGVVTEFVRIHPLSDSIPALSEIFPLHQGAEMVYADLRAGYNEAYRNYRKGHKSAIKKAMRSGVTVEFRPSDDVGTIQVLHQLYTETMLRKQAKTVYLQPLEHFIELMRALDRRALLVRSMVDGTIASASIFILGHKHVWFKYSGLNPSYRDLGAHTYALDRTIFWAAENGHEQFMLGGGMQPRDGIYLSKLGFSHAVSSVRHFRKVHNEHTLRLLTQAKRSFDKRLGNVTREDYFPSYWLS